MNLSYEKARGEDIEPICELCKRLIEEYEQLDMIDYPRVMAWIRDKIEKSIDEYTTVYVDGRKAGYYHFYKNDSDQFELDDLYIFPEYQNRGIGSEIIRKCCISTMEPIILYVFIENKRAISLYKRLGFKVIETIHKTRYIMKFER